MPLTNPNKVVTEERLSEFYGQILPYMGGMPDVLANKFSKGDLYSTEEKMIGQWTDGKPLYQKTFTNFDITSGADWYNTIDVNDLNAEYLIFTDILFNLTSAPTQLMSIASILRYYTLAFNNSIGYIQAYKNTNFTIHVHSLTIQYTKTTDTSIAIGSDTDYSTDEKIVGTWIDGRPVWQRTWTNLNKSCGYNSWVTIMDWNYDKLIDAEIISSTIGGLPCVELSTSTLSGKLQAQNTMPSTTRVLDTLTLRYTKTS